MSLTVDNKSFSKNKTFCVLPWLHTYIHTDGDVYPCCISWSPQKQSRIKNISEDSLENIFNSDFMKRLRLDMLSGISRDDVCSTCYKSENSGFSSLRTGKISQYKARIPAIVEQTEDDGFVKPVISSLDYRFSNLCNLKCRTCGPEFSSAWAQESGSAKGSHLLKPAGTDDVLSAHYRNIEKIYFAGGEPLLMPEHFRTLKALVDIGQASQVTLTYNSNITNLHYKNNDLISYWKQFKKIVIGASIDAVGNRAGYIRHGVNWPVIEKNLYTLMDYRKQFENFDFYYNPTISIYNADHISDMHRYLWENNLLPDINSIKFNILLNNGNFICSTLPEKIKETIHFKIEDTILWLEGLSAKNSTILQYKNLQAFLKQDSDPENLKNFINFTKSLDAKRNESFSAIFSEYSRLIEP